MNEFHIKAATLALQKMFRGRYFSICTVDNVLKITRSIPNKEDYNALHALHCVDWADMTIEFRNLVMMKTMQMFEQQGFDVEVISATLSSHTKRLN